MGLNVEDARQFSLLPSAGERKKKKGNWHKVKKNRKFNLNIRKHLRVVKHWKRAAHLSCAFAISELLKAQWGHGQLAFSDPH